MKKITIGGSEYTLEYTLGASLYDECVVSVSKLITALIRAEREADSENGEQDMEFVTTMISTLGGAPRVAVTVLYAGLLDHHGTGEYAGRNSDGRVPDWETAKWLAWEWLSAADDFGKQRSWFSLIRLCTDCMTDDGFFQKIGLEDLFSPGSQTTEEATTAEA